MTRPTAQLPEARRLPAPKPNPDEGVLPPTQPPVLASEMEALSLLSLARRLACHPLAYGLE